MGTRRIWIRMHPTDNVATALDSLKAGTEIRDDESKFALSLKTNIPFGHKFSLVDIPRGTAIQKYGEVIGEATEDIAAGEHVHVHNVESRRGRGDLHKEAQAE